MASTRCESSKSDFGSLYGKHFLPICSGKDYDNHLLVLKVDKFNFHATPSIKKMQDELHGN